MDLIRLSANSCSGERHSRFGIDGPHSACSLFPQTQRLSPTEMTVFSRRNIKERRKLTKSLHPINVAKLDDY
jgi:hypothetical protein